MSCPPLRRVSARHRTPLAAGRCEFSCEARNLLIPMGKSSRLVRSRGLEPPRVAPLAPQASASTNSATTACGSGRRPSGRRRGCGDVTNRPSGYKGGTGRRGRPGGDRAGALRDAAQRASGERGSSSLTSTAMRLPCTTTVPLATGKVVGEDLDLVILGGVQLDDGAAAEPQHLMDRHGGGAEHDRDIERNLVESGHSNPCTAASELNRPRSTWYGERVVNARTLSHGLVGAAAGRRLAAGRMARQRRAGAPTRPRSPRWTRAWPRSPRARRPSWSGCSSIRRSTPPAPAPGREELIEARFPVHQVGRGGQFTYHGPGQRVAYVMLDLNRRKPDVRALRRHAGGMDHPHARRLQRARRAARRPHRRLGAPAGQGRRLRGQDRRHRHPRAPLGDAARHRAQRRAGPCRISPASCRAACRSSATA